MSLRFDPPKKAPPVPEWATYCPTRTPKWKIHKRLSDAKNAFYAHTELILYRFKDGEWVELYRAEAPQPEECEVCSDSLYRQYGERRYRSSTRLWDPRSDELRLIVTCYQCARDVRRR